MTHEIAIVRTLWPYLNTHRYTVATIVVLGLTASLLEGIGIVLFIPILQILGSSEIGDTASTSLFSTALGPVSAEWRIPVLVLLVMASIAAKNLVTYVNGAHFARIDAENSHRMRCQLFSVVLGAGTAYVDQQPSGRLANALLSETWRLARALGALYRIVVEACAIVILAIVLLFLSWRTALYVAPFIGLIVLAMHSVTRHAKAIGEGAVVTNTVYTDRTWETLGGLSTVRTFGRGAFEEMRHAEASSRIRHFFLRAQLLSNRIPLLFETFVAIGLGFWIIALAWSGTGVPTIAVFLLVLHRMQPRIRSIIAARAELLELGSAALEIKAVMAEAIASRLPEGDRPFSSLAHSVDFRDVSATYPCRSVPAVSGISFQMPRNTTTALVGPSGSGKSTIAGLLLRNAMPVDGNIEVDGVSLASIRAGDWHARIAAVSQDIFLFDDTIAENIRYGKLDATPEEIADAARIAHAHEFVTELPEGYETRIGDRGSRLSGGQRQRIALARALIRKPEVLVIDEATNALDSHSETLIQHALDALSSTTTILTIAHRLSTVRKADQILVVESGRIVERGTYAQLLASGGTFDSMVRMQALFESGEKAN